MFLFATVTFSVGAAYASVDKCLPVSCKSFDEQVGVDRVAHVTLGVRQWLVAVSLKVVCQPSQTTTGQRTW